MQAACDTSLAGAVADAGTRDGLADGGRCSRGQAGTTNWRIRDRAISLQRCCQAMVVVLL